MRFLMRVGLALFAGVAAFLALFPFAGQDSDPPRFFSVFGWEVPIGDIWLSLLAGVAAAAIVWVVLGRKRD